MQRRPRRRGKERWLLPIDGIQRPQHEPRESFSATACYAFATGLAAATTLGALVSIVVPGRAFLVVWAFVTLTVSASAGWHADRVRVAAHRLLARVAQATRKR